jgi:hypothetical protein
MTNDPLALAKYFHEISDRELLQRCSADSLTDAARSIAYTELVSRGLALPAIVTAAAVQSEPYEGDFETVAQFFNPIDAFLLAGCLEAAGIPPVVADSNLVQLNSLLAIAVGGIRIRVPAARVAEAQEIMAAFQRGDLALPDDDESYRE